MIIASLIFLTLTVGAVFALDLAPAHEHSAHDHSINDVEYDAQNDIVWSIGQDPEAASVVFAGYSVESSEVVVTETFSNGHALAVGDGVVYIADQNTLWEYDVSTEEASELATMEHAAGAMEYDATRDLIWVAAGATGTVVAYDAQTGEVVMSHDEHGNNGLNSIAVNGDYVASVATWEPEVIVYDIEAESVAFEPTFDDIEDDEFNVVSTTLTDANEIVIGGGWDTVFHYDIESGEQLSQYAAHGFGAAAVEYYDQRDMIVSAGGSGTIAFFDVATGDIVQTYSHDDTIYTADLDTTNDILWFGDGEEQPGTVTGLGLSFDDPTPTPTADQTPPDGGSSSPDESDDGGSSLLIVGVVGVAVLLGGFAFWRFQT